MRLFNDRLENSELREELENFDSFKILEEQMSDILNMFWFQDHYNSLISFPHYLKLFKKFLVKNKSAKFTRPQFYDFIIKEGVPKDIRASLGKIAFVLEVLLVNELEDSELDNTLKKLSLTREGLKFSELKKSKILQTNTTEEDNKKITKTGFFHHTISEYLVASLFLSKKDPVGAFEQFAVYKSTPNSSGDFVSSWRGVLRFLLVGDKKEEFTDWALEFFMANKDSVTDEVLDVVLMEIEPNSLTKERNRDLFRFIFELYFDRDVWLPYWSGKVLGKFATADDIKLLKERWLEVVDSEDQYVAKGNIVAIIDGLLENKSKLLNNSDKEFWKEQFIKGANDSNTNGVVQRHSLSALENFPGDETLIDKVESVWKIEDSLVKDAFIEFCFSTFSNSKKTLDYLVKDICGSSGIYGRIGLYQVTSIERIIDLLTRFDTEKEFLANFLDKESIYVRDEKKADEELIINIDRACKSTVEKALPLVKNILIKTHNNRNLLEQRGVDSSYFIGQLHKIVKKYDPNYIFEFLDYITKDKEDESRRFIYDQAYYIAFWVDKDNEKNIFEIINKYDNNENIKYRVISQVERLDKEVGKVLHDKYINQQK
jgi:hypothetical protein